MSWKAPQRLSSEWWIWIVSGAFTFGLISIVVLYVLGVVTDPIPLLLLALSGSVLGDLLLAAFFEAVAPTKVTVAPGERARKSAELREFATVISGFEDSAEGRVRVRGEVWMARHHEEEILSLASGARVRVLEREGLILLIRLNE